MEILVEAGFTHDPDGRIHRVNESGGDPAPRFLLVRSREGNVRRFRYDLPEHTVRRLEELATSEPAPDDLEGGPRNLEAYLEVLREDGELGSVESGLDFRFPEELPAPTNVTRVARANLHLLRPIMGELEDIARDFEEGEPYVAVIEGGAAVSVCFSSRLTDRAACAGLETFEEYRGRGYAPAVVAEWARAVRATGRIPLYGTSWDNLASRAVARKLGLIQYGVGLSIG